MADHDHDLVHELSKRLDSIWRYDQYIANAEGHEELQSLWRDCKREDLAMVDRLREMIAAEIRQGCF
jgi:hypothetical protein